ncbi:hypothetical protein STSP2_00250 [Anaerohalosphaera lusitana]|uniref:Uncharacterized protein n=1 Tax=Anaerohalosphaera lusitana TaxID=1936003 RepID=A0A1U9NGP9_9BACT|nr:hypothetical protein [Anaerohalosphaera lusitana]AQT67109.1 hypothetical protein STSP2_00250 [Anaerohalosphaera lusitana]
MANAMIELPFYVSRAGEPLEGAAAGMSFLNLMTVGGVDKSGSQPMIEEIGGGWYKFNVAYGTAPFDEGDLVGVIDADAGGSLGLCLEERYIPVEARLDYYALNRLVCRMSQDKLNGDMVLKNLDGEGMLMLKIVEGESQVERLPEVV